MKPEPASVDAANKVRSLPLERWPDADRLAWVAACRPAERLKRGGGAAHMRDITRRDLADVTDTSSTTSSAPRDSIAMPKRPAMSRPIGSLGSEQSLRHGSVQ